MIDHSSIQNVELHNNCVEVVFSKAEGKIDRISARLLIDCMGHFSPIVRQSRQGQKPDGVCLVVGTCATGFDQNDSSDLIKTTLPIIRNEASGNRVQYFWEAFPAGTGPRDRTTYLFTYVDATPQRPSLENLFEDYWKWMPEYQNVDINALEFRRALFGFFPTYKDSPIHPKFDRIIHVGDAGGLQSPLSFGGFGAMLRHLQRHTDAISSALNAKIVDKDSLSLINPYNPGLSATWLFQKVMCAQEDTPPDFINNILSDNFRVMDRLGPKVLKPFLQDVTRFGPLSLTLSVQVLTNPGFVVTAARALGVSVLLEWLPHFMKLGGYEVAATASGPIRKWAEMMPPRDMYKLCRLADAFVYGSGVDYDRVM